MGFNSDKKPLYGGNIRDSLNLLPAIAPRDFWGENC
jgi:hypothetical protein